MRTTAGLNAVAKKLFLPLQGWTPLPARSLVTMRTEITWLHT